MNQIDYNELNRYSKQFVHLTDEKIKILHNLSPVINPYIQTVTDNFYSHLKSIDKTHHFIDDKVDMLKVTHYEWIKSLFQTDFDIKYTQEMYNVGLVHVRISLPIEFMLGGMSIIEKELTAVIHTIYPDNNLQIKKTQQAITAAISFSLLIMQDSYQTATLSKELDHFLEITGMSRNLFRKLSSINNIS